MVPPPGIFAAKSFANTTFFFCFPSRRAGGGGFFLFGDIYIDIAFLEDSDPFIKHSSLPQGGGGGGRLGAMNE